MLGAVFSAISNGNCFARVQPDVKILCHCLGDEDLDNYCQKLFKISVDLGFMSLIVLPCMRTMIRLEGRHSLISGSGIDVFFHFNILVFCCRFSDYLPTINFV